MHSTGYYPIIIISSNSKFQKYFFFGGGGDIDVIDTLEAQPFNLTMSIESVEILRF